MIAALLAAAVAAATPTPSTDQVTVCLAAIAEKAQSVAAGGEAVSIAVPLYTAAQGMSDNDAADFQRGCDLFEQGFLMAANAISPQPPADVDVAEDEGAVPEQDPTT